MSAASKRKREAFAHAADYGPALRELSGAILALVSVNEVGPLPLRVEDARRVAWLSSSALWQDADEKVAAWSRVAAAARRVEVARSGRDSARRTVGFRRASRAS